MSDKSGPQDPRKAAAVLSADSLSACLAEAVRTPLVAYVGAAPDGYDGPVHGAELRAERWQPPAIITADMVVEANRWRAQHEQRNGYVQSGVLSQWLAIVISGSARRVGDDVDEAARLAALSFAVEEHPAYCFTKTTLRAAQRRFKFMPTPSELLEFCDAIVTAEKQTADRLWKIVETGVTTGTTMREQEVTRSMQINREAAERERVALAAAAGIEVPVAPPQDPGESDRDYCLRLSALAKAHCVEGGRALRQAERQLARAAAAPAPAAAAPTVGESALAAAPVEGVGA